MFQMLSSFWTIWKSRSFGAEIIQFYELLPRVSKDGEFEKIYQLPLIPRYRDEKKKIRICQFGCAKQNTKQVNILVVGTTGSGKSTAVNALINYLANVRFKDDHRLEIVSLEESEILRVGEQADSQTDWITVYEICTMRSNKVKYQVNIVDTPGFGDTRGKERDDQTFDQLRHLFKHGLTSVNAVCICVNGTETRLYDRQEYVFQSVMKSFGNDILKNLFIWTTFTDEEEPPVLTSIKKFGIDYKAHFSFENGTLFKKIPDAKKKIKSAKGKFEDVYETFDAFFEKIENVQPQSLENSRQVLEQRNNLIKNRSEIEVDIRRTVKCLEEQKKFEEDIKSTDNKPLTANDCYLNVTLQEQCISQVYNCESCKSTCCDPCDHFILKRLFFYECANLGWDDYCKKCRCHSARHQYSKLQRYVTKNMSLSDIEDIQTNKPGTIVLKDDEQKLMKKKKNLVEVAAQKDKNKKQEVLDKTRTKTVMLENHLQESLMTLHNALEILKRTAIYEEQSSVSQILKEIKEGDKSSNGLEAEKIYAKLTEYISKNNL